MAVWAAAELRVWAATGRKAGHGEEWLAAAGATEVGGDAAWPRWDGEWVAAAQNARAALTSVAGMGTVPARGRRRPGRRRRSLIGGPTSQRERGSEWKMSNE